jgi:hypothetical protein
MTASVWTDGSDLSSAAGTALKLSARFWFLVAVLGQWFFVAYVVAFYGGAALRGDLMAWNKVLPHGYTPGHLMSNVAVAGHLFLAVVIMVGGPLQIIPQVRGFAPRFHRLNGRLYMVAVVATSIAGLYMVWSRGRSSVIQSLGISLDAILIMTFAVLALRYALARHQHASPVDAPPVHGGERRLVLPDRVDGVDLPQSRPHRVRFEDVHRTVPQLPVVRRLPAPAGHSRGLPAHERSRQRERPVRHIGRPGGGDGGHGRRDLCGRDGHVAAAVLEGAHMTVKTNARLAGFMFLFYFAVAATDVYLFNQAAGSAEGPAAQLASLAQHAQLVRLDIVIKKIMFVCAVALAVALYALTRNQDRDLALIALCCRVSEGMTALVSAGSVGGLLSVAKASAAAAGPDAAAAQALGHLLMNQGGGGSFPFAVGSTLFAYLFLRARSIPVPLAWLGVVASILLVVGIPVQVAGFLHGPFTWLMWIPMAVFEVTLGLWLLIKGVATDL